MPESGRSEIFFIVAMMLLTLILSGFAMYFFVKTYKKEMREREAERSRKQEAGSKKPEVRSQQSEVGK